MSLMFILPNHKCPSKDCPFHASEMSSKKKLFEAPAEEIQLAGAAGAGIEDGSKLRKGPKKKIRTAWKTADVEAEEERRGSMTGSVTEDDVVTVLSVDTGNESGSSECEARFTLGSVASDKVDVEDVVTEFYADTGIDSLASDDVHLDDIQEEIADIALTKLEKIEEIEMPLVEQDIEEFDVDDIKEEIVFATEPEVPLVSTATEQELILKSEEQVVESAVAVRVVREVCEEIKVAKHVIETQQIYTTNIQEEVIQSETLTETHVAVERLKDGEEVLPSPRAKATYKDGMATLDLKDLEPEDGGKYTCRATNSFGDIETTANLKVEEVRHRRRKKAEEAKLKQPKKEVSEVEADIPPEFTLPLIDQVAPVGDSIELTVTVTCRPEAEVDFYHGDEKVSAGGRFKLKQDKDVYSLIISDLRLEDAGEWSCHATNAFGKTQCSCDVQVLDSVPEGSKKPRFTRGLDAMTITEGSKAQLKCRVTGLPQPQIEWYKDRQRIEASRHYEMIQEDDDIHILVIDGATKDDTGSYMCRAVNEAGSASTEARIRVQKVSDQEIQREDTTRVTAAPTKQYRFQMAPDFTVKLRNKSVLENSHVRLACSVTGIPDPTIKWYKDGQDITDMTRYTILNNYGLLSLEILRTATSDSGCYTCEASNCEGTVTCSASLDVQCLDRMSPEFDQRPRFLNPLGDICIREGEDAVFECTATGKPSPSFKWQKDVREVFSSSRINIESDKDGKARLVVKNARLSDSGLYVCVAYSLAGRCKCSGSLRVIEKSPSPPSQDELMRLGYGPDVEFDPLQRITEPGRPPYFSIMLPRQVEVTEGQKLRLDCAVEGFPTPVVSWHKSVRELSYGERHRIMMCATLHTMEIPSAMTIDSGEYIVRATNVFGSVETSCFVKINLKDPESEEYVEPVYTPRDRAPVELRRDGTSKPPQAPFFIKHLPPRIDVMEGVDVQLDCILRGGIDLVQYSDEGADQAKKGLEEEGFVGGFVDMGRLAAPSSPQVSAATGSPPVFEKKLTDVQAPVDSLVNLVTSVIDDPVADITWFKDGKEITQGDKYEIFFDAGCHNLEIYDTEISDSGVYKCVAVNALGSTACQCTVTIQDSDDVKATTSLPADDSGKEAPNFTSTPSDLTLPAGSEAVFECSVTGKPTPEVAWFKDGKPVTPNDCLRIVAKGNKHQLRISAIVKSDEGQYVATATSDAGTKSCAARLTIQVLATKFATELPAEVSASKGDSATLTCGTPQGVKDVHWELNGKKVNKSHQAVMTSEPDGTQTLELKNLIKSNFGTYSCVAKMADKTTLTTKTKLVLEEVVEMEEDMRKPKFVKTLMDLSCRDGDMVNLECQVRGDPRPQITWYRDGEEIPDTQDFQMSMIGTTCKLCIVEVFPEDEGKYECKAVSSGGEATTSCIVFVEDVNDMSIDTESNASSLNHGKPSPPHGKPSVAEITHNSLSLSWQPPKLTNGGTIIAYMIELYELNSKDWVTLTKSCQGNGYKARNLQPNTSYQFRIRAENIFGRSKPGNLSEIVQTSSFDVHDFSPSKEKKLTVRRSSTNTLVPVEGRVAAILNHSSPVIETTSVRCPEESRATLQRDGFRSSLQTKKRSGSSLIPGTKTNSLGRLRTPQPKFPSSHDHEIRKDGKGSNRNSIEDSDERVPANGNNDSDARSDLGSECNTLSQSSGSDFLGKDVEDEPDGDHRVSEDMMLSAPVCDDVKLALYSRKIESYSDEKLHFLSDEGIDTSRPVNPDFRTLRSMLQSSDVIIKPTQSLPEISDVCRGKDGRGSLRQKLTPIVDEEDDDSVRVTTL